MMRHLPIRRPGAVLLVACLSLFVFAGVADAHAELEDATPNRNAEVEGSPPEISGIYSQAMDPDGSSLKLVDASDELLAEGGVDPENDLRMVISPVPELAPGEYTVESTTKSAADGDIDRTKWSFTVLAAPTAEPTPEPTASPTPAPTASPTAAPTATPTPVASASASTAPTSTPAASPAASSSASAAPTAGTDGDDAGSTGPADVLLPIVVVAILGAIVGILYTRRRTSPKP